MFAVRSSPHINLSHPERGGGSVTPEELTELYIHLNRRLLDANFNPVAYGEKQEFMEAIAYTPSPCPPRSEPIVIDNGGTWIPCGVEMSHETFANLMTSADRARAFNEWFRSREGIGRVLTICVRKGMTENHALVSQVEQTLMEANLDLSECRISQNCNNEATVKFDPEDVVFAVTSDAYNDDDGGPDQESETAPISVEKDRVPLCRE